MRHSVVILGLATLSYSACDSSEVEEINGLEEPTIEGAWSGQADYHTSGNPIDLIIFDLDLLLTPERDLLQGSGSLRVRIPNRSSPLDTTITLSIMGALMDSVATVDFDPIVLGFLTGYSGLSSADTLDGFLTHNLLLLIPIRPILLTLVRQPAE